ncbi:hypothetical protein HH214_01110 [Mucilaginibacter robiniae]|uniref:Histidine kinase/HSP90-like ATPase domain-containing protein n=1 Tax=Mucilaginibacter robiniae TaxID=2728022 RepID=A0A7L5DTZ3_9SPHI|nr:ATP-binding protein [Mucilaginibacter robiniae]QJD94570.1 hypothetical protein HH214_01110 [Mucilaginibacter robiniae]
MQLFNFNHHPHALSPMVKEIMAHVQQLPYSITDDLPFKVKYIVTELLTNALKHSVAAQSSIHLSVNNGYLHIHKADEGAPLPILLKLAVTKTGQPILVGQDVLYRLYGIQEEKNRIKFIGEELECIIDVNQVTEHFGLQIITRMADEFIYQYDEPTNLFTVRIKLD